MMVQTFPKPKIYKQRRAKNNPKPTINDICIQCGRPFAETHEVFYGRGKRQLSIKYKMQAKLCCMCHKDAPYSVHKNKEMDLILKRKYQRIFEKQYGHEKFMEVFGRNYL